MTEIDCSSCRRRIDSDAKLCPFCGADPRTGVKFDPTPMVEQHFNVKKKLGARETLRDFLQRRQGVALGVIGAVVLLLGFGLYHLASRRNEEVAGQAPPVPLTDLADLNAQAEENPVLPMPEIPFQFEGTPSRLRTLVVEPGAIAPAPAPGALPVGASPPAAGTPIGPIRTAPAGPAGQLRPPAPAPSQPAPPAIPRAP